MEKMILYVLTVSDVFGCFRMFYWFGVIWGFL